VSASPPFADGSTGTWRVKPPSCERPTGDGGLNPCPLQCSVF
jgi:hypothetical protein